MHLSVTRLITGYSADFAELSSGTELSLQELNQLLLLSHEGSVTEGFFSYYWLERPSHAYDVEFVDGYEPDWFRSRPTKIGSLEQFRWGLYRLYVDALLYFGNVRTGFRHLRTMQYKELNDFFAMQRIDTKALMERGPYLPLELIAKEDRYLVSEMAAKSYPSGADSSSELKKALLEAWHLHAQSGGGRTELRHILSEDRVRIELADRYNRTLFSAHRLLNQFVGSSQEVEEEYAQAAAAYKPVREAALRNTALYLSMVNEMDVYVATSMRSPLDFEQMANFCEEVFSDPRLMPFKLRHFDPTQCAADGHEDKGLTECLMVKCAKALVYCAGKNDSYGKDAEAAMALSLGKPVIFYCDEEQRKNFYRDTHPLSRLIEFKSGVAVGAMVTDSLNQVKELLVKLFTNKMQYKLEQRSAGSGYLRLIEPLTNSVVRVQTSDELLAETFWNHYHNK